MRRGGKAAEGSSWRRGLGGACTVHVLDLRSMVEGGSDWIGVFVSSEEAGVGGKSQDAQGLPRGGR
jgi:hypothetical protein